MYTFHGVLEMDTKDLFSFFVVNIPVEIPRTKHAVELFHKDWDTPYNPMGSLFNSNTVALWVVHIC